MAIAKNAMVELYYRSFMRAVIAVSETTEAANTGRWYEWELVYRLDQHLIRMRCRSRILGGNKSLLPGRGGLETYKNKY